MRWKKVTVMMGGGGVLEGQLVSVRLFQNGKNIRCLLQEYLFWIFPAIRDVTV